MSKDTKNKSMGWFKGVLSGQNEIESGHKEVEAPPETVEMLIDNAEKIESIDSPVNKQFFQKDNQDKVSLDLIVSVENMLKDRQLILYKKKGLEEQLYNANEMIRRLKHDDVKKEQLLQEKNKEISVLEGKLTNKQMSYDQLLEDYKDYQTTSNNEFEKMTNQLEKEMIKYAKLSEESTNTQYQNMLKIKELEERVRNLEVENQNYMEQYERIVEEKTELMQTINDFTERMSISFSAKTAASSTPSE
ncbi:hypothetical protein CU633_02335 [Bacillus sp. V3-13]|uniref:hypothetical protein n=1 Tax=Bacillus sp. V3-13 TaxID=2053728 RepID=UPI000C760C61|nr:hypothetical protein [Bacillus sp. V3-13]PLR79044.1 hypothetical protein CU633_02335 [Bacillus sp. V3-13]